MSDDNPIFDDFGSSADSLADHVSGADPRLPAGLSNIRYGASDPSVEINWERLHLVILDQFAVPSELLEDRVPDHTGLREFNERLRRIGVEDARAAIKRVTQRIREGKIKRDLSPALSRPQDNSPMLPSAVREKRIAEAVEWLSKLGRIEHAIWGEEFIQAISRMFFERVDCLYYSPHIIAAVAYPKACRFEVLACRLDSSWAIRRTFIIDHPRGVLAFAELFIQVDDWLTELERADHADREV